MTDDDAAAPARRAVGIVAYGVLFSVGLPTALAAWMLRLDSWLTLPRYGSIPMGLVPAIAGSALIAAAVSALWRFGRGLPMSPFPPQRFVTRGAYGVVAHPLYIGAVLVCAGAALALRSAGGLWVVTPVLTLAAAAFVWGFERPMTLRRFGPQPAPWLRLPDVGDGPPATRDQASVLLLVVLPSFILFEAVSLMTASLVAWPTYTDWDRHLPFVPWTAALQSTAYALALATPFVAGRRRDLRRFALRGLGATSGLLLFYLLVPVGACSLPAFPVVWACVAAEVWAARWPRAKAAAVVACAAIGVSCVTAGTHTVLDVASAFVAYGFVVQRAALWSWMCRRSESVANSWREWRVGPVRFMSHGVYAAVGGAAGAGIAVWLAGMNELWWVLGLTLGGQAGAALWAQFVEGSPQLLRPYGYFGSIVGVVMLAAGAGLAGHDPWLLLGAMAIGGCVTQILGRLRCLVQGCCHGRPIDAPWGIRHTHPRSRVVRLSAFGGQRLHPTALYSMVWMLGVFAALLRLWLAGVPLPFISGSYLLLVGLGRFVEEHYRGEPQTAVIGGMRLYQWLAIVFVVGGAALTAVGGPATPTPLLPEVRLWPVLALLLVTTYAAYGVDFPGSNRRFSRLV